MTCQKSNTISWCSNSGLVGSSGGGFHCSPPLCLPPHLEPARGGSQKDWNQWAGWFTDRNGLEGRSRLQVSWEGCRGRRLPCSLLTKPVRGSVCKPAFVKAVTPGAMAGGNPEGSSHNFSLAFCLSMFIPPSTLPKKSR